jgi:hypothetical protein
VAVKTFTQTPRLNGDWPCVVLFLSVFKLRAIAGDLLFLRALERGFWMSWLIVGIVLQLCYFIRSEQSGQAA